MRVLLIVLLWINVASSRAQLPTYYGYYPKTVMSLGRGFSLDDITEPKDPCVNFIRTPLDDNKGAIDTTATITMVADESKLRNALSVDTSVDASYLMFQGSSTFKYSQERLFSSDSMTLVLRFASTFPSAGLDNNAD